MRSVASILPLIPKWTREVTQGNPGKKIMKSCNNERIIFGSDEEGLGKLTWFNRKGTQGKFDPMTFPFFNPAVTSHWTPSIKSYDSVIGLTRTNLDQSPRAKGRWRVIVGPWQDNGSKWQRSFWLPNFSRTFGSLVFLEEERLEKLKHVVCTGE